MQSGNEKTPTGFLKEIGYKDVEYEKPTVIKEKILELELR